MTPASRSRSRRSSAIHSSGRSPVPAANTGIAANRGSSSTLIAPMATKKNVKIISPKPSSTVAGALKKSQIYHDQSKQK